MRLIFRPILSGLATFVPGFNALQGTGGTISARYCYSVWLRHLTLAHESGLLQAPPSVVAELGPGDSIGIGLAALLTGVNRYQALDVVKYANDARNITILEELVDLFQQREPIPDQYEFPLIKPYLHSYAFPHHILTDTLLETALSNTRVDHIRRSIAQPESTDSMIFYAAPWDAPDIIEDGTVDMIFSQAVLEHVNDLASVYQCMRRWLKPTGFLSHQIDFKSHGKAATWDGHWAYSDSVWRVIVGKRPYLLNREPYSTHVRLLHQNGFRLVKELLLRAEMGISRSQLAERYRVLSDDDLSVSGAYVLATTAV